MRHRRTLRRRYGHRGHGWLKDTAVRAGGVAKQAASGAGSLARRAAPHVKSAVSTAGRVVASGAKASLHELRKSTHDATPEMKTHDQEEHAGSDEEIEQALDAIKARLRQRKRSA